jgi:hypothetical protein
MTEGLFVVAYTCQWTTFPRWLKKFFSRRSLAQIDEYPAADGAFEDLIDFRIQTFQ